MRERAMALNPATADTLIVTFPVCVFVFCAVMLTILAIIATLRLLILVNNVRYETNLNA